MRRKLRTAFMEILVTASPEQRRAVLKTISPSQLDSISEIVYNVLYNETLRLSPGQLAKLRSRKTTIRKLADRSVGFANKKRLLLSSAEEWLPDVLKAVLKRLKHGE
jgi:hypothetical protein